MSKEGKSGLRNEKSKTSKFPYYCHKCSIKVLRMSKCASQYPICLHRVINYSKLIFSIRFLSRFAISGSPQILIPTLRSCSFSIFTLCIKVHVVIISCKAHLFKKWPGPLTIPNRTWKIVNAYCTIFLHAFSIFAK